MELAAKGTSANIDTYVADLKAPYNNDFYHLFPDESYCFGFGKAAGKHKGKYFILVHHVIGWLNLNKLVMNNSVLIVLNLCPRQTVRHNTQKPVQ